MGRKMKTRMKMTLMKMMKIFNSNRRKKNLEKRRKGLKHKWDFQIRSNNNNSKNHSLRAILLMFSLHQQRNQVIYNISSKNLIQMTRSQLIPRVRFKRELN